MASRESDFVMPLDFNRSPDPLDDLFVSCGECGKQWRSYNNSALRGGSEILDRNVLIEEIKPLVKDVLLSYINESPSFNIKQLQAAILAAITAFITTIMEDAHPDQGYRAAINVSKSLPHIIAAANQNAKRIRNPIRKVASVIDVTGDLLNQSVKKGLTGVSPNVKEHVGNTVEGVMKLYTLSSSDKGSKKGSITGSGVFDSPLSGYNIGWLDPGESSTYGGGGIFDFFNFSSSDNSTTASDIPSADNSTTYTASPSTSGISDQDLDFSSFSNYSHSMNSTTDTTTESAPADTSTLLNNKTKTGLAGLIGSAIGWATGNPMGALMAMQVALPVLEYAVPIVASVGKHLIAEPIAAIGDATYGRFRRYVKGEEWNATPMKALKAFYKGSDVVTGWAGDKVAKIKKDFYNDDTKKNFQKLGAVIKQALPAMTQDYLIYLQKKQAYDKRVQRYSDLQKKAEEETTYRYNEEVRKTKEENAGIRAQNAKIIADSVAANKEDLNYNSNLRARYDQALADVAARRKLNKEVVDEYNKRQDEIHDINVLIEQANRQKLSLEATAEANAKFWNLVGGIGSVVIGTVGLLSGIGAPEGLAAITAGGGLIISAMAHSDKAKIAQQEAERYASMGDHAKAVQMQNVVVDEIKAGEMDLSKAAAEQDADLQHREAEAAKIRKELAKAAGEALKKGTEGMAEYGKAQAKAKAALDLLGMDTFVLPAEHKKEEYIPDPLEPEYRVVREVIKEGDPRLIPERQMPNKPPTPIIPMEEPLPPPDLYSARATSTVFNQVLPQMFAAIDGKKTSSSDTTSSSSLPYISPMPNTHVNPSSGSNSGLRTVVVNTKRPAYDYSSSSFGVPIRGVRSHPPRMRVIRMNSKRQPPSKKYRM